MSQKGLLMNKKIMNEYDDVICKANLNAFKQKTKQLRYLISDEDELERALIELCVDMLVEHGKSRELIRQISQISRILAESLGLGKSYCSTLEQAARIYDIGNLLVCSEIYLKDDALNFEEFKIVKNHTLWGYNLLIAQHFLTTDIAAVISAEHHEWFNGGGYPRGTKGDQIDIAARIVSVADSVGTLFSERPGRVPWDYERIVSHISNRSGIEFDPGVTEVFKINQEIIYQVLCSDISAIEEQWYA